MTEEETIEFVKCARNPVYFLNNYGYIFDITKNTIARLNLFEYQKEVVENYELNKNNIILKARQCVPENTYIDTPEGPKQIINIKAGDIIYSYNFQINQIEEDIVSEQWCSDEKQCIDVILEDGKNIEVGENHPFYDINKKQWVPANHLQKGDSILTVEGNQIIVSLSLTTIKNCYDITVEKNENFLIKGVVVHNTGLSVITSGYVCWKMLFNENERILIVANDGAGARRFLGSVKQFLDYLPEFLRPDAVPTNNTQQIVFSNGSWCKAVASGGNAGRGETLTLLVLDETAFIENAEEIWMAAGLALSSESAKCIMISTPNGTGGLYHATWTETIKKQKTGKKAFVGKEVHWSQHPYYARDAEEREDEHGRKFWWSPWYEEQCALLKYDKVKIAQELDLSFEGSAAVVIESWIIDKYDKTCSDIKPICYYDYKEPVQRFIDDRQTQFYVWEKPIPKANYIIGGDVARGDSADFSTLQVINADTLTQVAEFQGKMPPDLFAEVVYKVAIDYNMAYVAVEGNNHGLVTTLALKNTLKYPFDKIHHSKSIRKIYVRYGGVNSIDPDSEIPGFQTTPKTRPLLMNCLVKYMRDSEVKINSKRLLTEFRTFINKGEKPEHADGYHDDLIFAFAIALFMRDTEFDNVFKSKEFYKAMLDSISYHSNTNGMPTTNVQQEVRANVQKPDSDLGWLLGPIQKG